MRRALILALAGVTAFPCGLAEGGARDAPGPGLASPVTMLGVHPDARRQPTATGRTIATLAAHGGRVYTGYGDYGANTGPVTLRAVTPDRGFTPVLARVPSEALYLFRPYRGGLAAPYVDPRADARAGYVAGAGDAFEPTEGVRATHVFDLVERADGTTWLFGSRDNDAMVWRRAAGHRAFEVVLEAAPEGEAAFARAYGGFEFDGAICTHIRHVGGTLARRAVCRMPSGDWTDGPVLFPDDTPYEDHFAWKPTPFAGRLVYMDAHGGVNRVIARLFATGDDGPTYAFGTRDAYESRDPRDFIVDFTVGNGALYVLNRLGEVWRSPDLTVWTPLARIALPGTETAASIAVDDAGALYVGTTASRVLGVTGPPVPVGPVPRSPRALVAGATGASVLLVAALAVCAVKRPGRRRRSL